MSQANTLPSNAQRRLIMSTAQINDLQKIIQGEFHSDSVLELAVSQAEFLGDLQAKVLLNSYLHGNSTCSARLTLQQFVCDLQLMLKVGDHDQQVTLPVQTNSCHGTPDFGLFDRSELNDLYLKNSSLIDWSSLQQVVSISILTTPGYDFLNVDGTKWEGDDVWEPTVVHVNQCGLMIDFSHKHTGESLFFSFHYVKKPR